jgi:hypothetical protein
MLGALRIVGSIGLVAGDASLRLGIAFIAKKIQTGLRGRVTRVPQDLDLGYISGLGEDLTT